VSTGPLDVPTVALETGPLPATSSRRRDVDAGLMYPLSHRSRMRVAVVVDDGVDLGVDLAGLPDATGAARGWATLLEDRGARVSLGDDALGERIDLARAQVLLDPDPGPAAVAALEDWGFDDEAAWGWRGLSLRNRRLASRRPEPGPVLPDDPAGFLVALRAALVHEVGDRTLALLASFRDEWRGAPIEVHAMPTRLGRVSYAVRWHGERPALLWEVADAAPALVLRAPGLDPTWSSTAPSGEALLAPPAP
jgi:hypothetical protein